MVLNIILPLLFLCHKQYCCHKPTLRMRKIFSLLIKMKKYSIEIAKYMSQGLYVIQQIVFAYAAIIFYWIKQKIKCVIRFKVQMMTQQIIQIIIIHESGYLNEKLYFGYLFFIANILHTYQEYLFGIILFCYNNFILVLKINTNCIYERFCIVEERILYSLTNKRYNCVGVCVHYSYTKSAPTIIFPIWH